MARSRHEPDRQFEVDCIRDMEESPSRCREGSPGPGSPRPATVGVPKWMLSAWPMQDPEDWEHPHPSNTTPADRALALAGGAPARYQPGPPKPDPEPRDMKELNEIMKPHVVEYNQLAVIECEARSPRAITCGSSVLQQEAEAREAFQMFQVLRDNIGYLHVFDLVQTMTANGIPVDDEQEEELKRAFGLTPADFITFEQYKHMAEVVLSGRLGRSPPRKNREIMPGSPEYVADKVEKVKDNKGKPAPKASVPNYKGWMANSMGINGMGVDLPLSVRRQHYDLKEGTAANGKAVLAEKKGPAIDWSPFDEQR